MPSIVWPAAPAETASIAITENAKTWTGACSMTVQTAKAAVGFFRDAVDSEQ